MRNILLFLFLMFSANCYSSSLDQVIKKYGKNAVIFEIQKGTTQGLTIYLNGEYRQVHMPNSDYVTANTIAVDLDRIGLSAPALEALLKKNSESIKKTKRISEKERLALEQQYREDYARRQAQKRRPEYEVSTGNTNNRHSVKVKIIQRCRAQMSEYGARQVKFCVDKDIAAYNALTQYSNQEHSIINRCYSQMKEYGYRQVKYCADKDIEAERALSKY